MATTPLNFFTGPESNINSLAKKQGQVIFAINGDETTGNIYQDISNTKRIKIGKNAETAQKDANGNVITDTYETKIDTQNKLDAILENLKNKSNIDHTHAAYDEAISDLEDEVAIDYSQIAFDTGSEYVDSGIDFSVYQTKADGTLSTTAKTVSGAINELDAGIDNEVTLRANADTALDNKIAQISNPNLLINSDFRNPINQRGQTEYAGTSSHIYTIDRWRLDSSSELRTVTVLDDCIRLANAHAQYETVFRQQLEKALPISNYTLTVKVRAITGNMTACVGNTIKNLELGMNYIIAENVSVERVYIGMLANSSCDIEYIKLEQGSIATPFVPRPIGEELALCQRYYQESGVDCFPGYGFCNYLETQAIISIPTSVRMRHAPTIIPRNYGCLYGQGTTETFVQNDIADILVLDSGIQFRVNNLETTTFGKNRSVTCAFVGGYEFDAEIY